MMRRGSIGLLVIVSLAGAAGAAEVPTHRQRVWNLPGIPGTWDYRPSSVVVSPARSAQSLPGVLLETPPPRPQDGSVLIPDARAKVRYFQLGVRQIGIDHCSLSRVVVAVQDDGMVLVSFRADQNVRLIDDPSEPRPSPFTQAPLLAKQVEHLKRNEFFVRVRFLGASGPRETQAPAELGRAALQELCLPPFWVQRGEPFVYFDRIRVGVPRDFFTLIDRVEVQFSYR